ncbi:hypothetical protein HDV05_004254 [Chytridiales sp. JEL 0842]|nr:hypothetical protein HDV05_004254 [Chytridiales sp. JEL 0842]
MPELPEVERARRLLHGVSVGKSITRIDAQEDSIVFTDSTTHASFKAALEGRLVKDTQRRGKMFWMVLDGDEHPLMHFGMTGSIRVKGQPGLKYIDFDTSDDNWPPRFWKFNMILSDGTEIAFTDPRRLARIRIIRGDPHLSKPVSDLGFDPMLNMPPLSDFSSLILKRNMPIKALLLDQSFSAGVGNWVADEVLYQAGIHPGQITASLTEEELEMLHGTMERVVREACEVNADSDRFPREWLFHYRWFKGKRGVEAKLPNGNKITFDTIGGRTTAVVPAVQKLRKRAVDAERKAPLSPKKKKQVKRKAAEDEGADGVDESTVTGKSTKRALKKVKVEMKEDDDFEAAAVEDDVQPKVKQEETVSRRSGRRKAVRKEDALKVEASAAVTKGRRAKKVNK